MTTAVEVPTWTEVDLLDLLRQRYTRDYGNGPRYVFMTHVRSAPGFDARRCLDAMAMDLWPSSGNELHGFEVKTGRSDWLRELAQPGKAGEFTGRVDRFWIVAPAGVVAPGELPDNWGLMCPGRGTLRVARPARRVDRSRAVDPAFLACLLRAARYEAGRGAGVVPA